MYLVLCKSLEPRLISFPSLEPDFVLINSSPDSLKVLWRFSLDTACFFFHFLPFFSFVFFNHRTELKMSGNRFSSESKNKRRSSGQRYNSEYLQASVKHSESSVLVCDAFQLLVLGIFFKWWSYECRFWYQPNVWLSYPSSMLNLVSLILWKQITAVKRYYFTFYFSLIYWWQNFVG